MIVLVMGTTGSGKTTIGALLAKKLGWTFLDADDFHPAANIAKMKQGTPLNDADRVPWLAAIHKKLAQLKEEGKSGVLGCSALKQSYRDTLGAGLDMRIVYLKGTYEEMRAHILARHGHFAGEGILAGQFRDLEEPKDAIVVSVALAPDQIVQTILRELHPS
ncbi:MAG: gluconokinase [Acidobacteria bacterium]|nr:gluconokinase [Acidobacteriota bacterium]MBS1865051.1 gluconokinase [Acidobacteriota bacterium]